MKAAGVFTAFLKIRTPGCKKIKCIFYTNIRLPGKGALKNN
jgi:hypothetical protein